MLIFEYNGFQKNIPVPVLENFNFQGHLSYDKKTDHSYLMISEYYEINGPRKK